MDCTIVRLSAHILLIGWATAIAFLLILARGQTVRVVHVPIAVAGLILFTLWIVCLIATMKSGGIIPRETVIPLLAFMELGTGICAWGWLLLSARYSFQFSIKKTKTNANSF